MLPAVLLAELPVELPVELLAVLLAVLLAELLAELPAVLPVEHSVAVAELEVLLVELPAEQLAIAERLELVAPEEPWRTTSAFATHMLADLETLPQLTWAYQALLNLTSSPPFLAS